MSTAGSSVALRLVSILPNAQVDETLTGPLAYGELNPTVPTKALWSKYRCQISFVKGRAYVRGIPYLIMLFKIITLKVTEIRIAWTWVL